VRHIKTMTKIRDSVGTRRTHKGKIATTNTKKEALPRNLQAS